MKDPICGMSGQPSDSKKSKSQGAEYTCPMHPQIQQDKPGPCPLCGMALEHKLPAAEEPNPELKEMKHRFLFSLGFTIPSVLLAMSGMIPGKPSQHIFSPHAANLVQLALAAPVFLWGAAPLLVRGWQSLKNRSPNMFTLLALGIGASFVYSAIATLFPNLLPASLVGHGGEVPVYFEAASVITALSLLGQVLELKARSQTQNAIKELLKLSPQTARILRDNGIEADIPLESVQRGDKLRVRPGEKVPVDGVVLEGASSVNESMITGEAIPVQKTKDSKVIGGTINGEGSFIMQAERVGHETLLAQIVRMVSEAQRSRAPIQRLADKVSFYFVPGVMAAAFGTFGAWSLLGPAPQMAYALVNAIATLIIACPCALGLATPMSIMVGTGRGANAGVLIKNAEALETLEKVNTLIVDKTGTLTEGKPRFMSVRTLPGQDESELLRLAASLEQGSEHPLAAAIVEVARQKNLQLSNVENFESKPGKGVMGRVSGKSIVLGNEKLFEQLIIPLGNLWQQAEEMRRDGQTVVHLAVDGHPAGLLSVADPIKDSAYEAIKELQNEKIEVAMVTGDNHVTAEAVARKLQIDTVRAEVLPEQKKDMVKEFQSRGQVVAMAGDGVNDAPALAQAQVGIAMGTGTDVAMESAGITLVKGDLRGIVRARKLSRSTMRNIRQNLFLAFAYNTVGIPIAAGVLYPFFGLLLNPMVAAGAMTFSSVSVIGNALRLRKLKL